MSQACAIWTFLEITWSLKTSWPCSILWNHKVTVFPSWTCPGIRLFRITNQYKNSLMRNSQISFDTQSHCNILTSVGWDSKSQLWNISPCLASANRRRFSLSIWVVICPVKNYVRRCELGWKYCESATKVMTLRMKNKKLALNTQVVKTYLMIWKTKPQRRQAISTSTTNNFISELVGTWGKSIRIK